MILATLRGDSFGQGAHALAAGENALVLFMLLLHSGVLALILLAVWFTRRRQRLRRLPAETEDLLEELNSPPLPATERDSLAAPWEREADWWKSAPDQHSS
jgi:flagellar biogenesis protein FliO